MPECRHPARFLRPTHRDRSRERWICDCNACLGKGVAYIYRDGSVERRENGAERDAHVLEVV